MAKKFDSEFLKNEDPGRKIKKWLETDANVDNKPEFFKDELKQIVKNLKNNGGTGSNKIINEPNKI